MRRLALRLVLILFLGAIINIAVAWGCVHWADPMSDGYVPASTIEELERCAPPPFVVARGFSSRSRSFGIVFDSVVGSFPVDTPLNDSVNPDVVGNGPGMFLQSVTRLNAGWPILALRQTAFFNISGEEPQSKFMNSARVGGHRFPCAPIPLGMVVNIIFYATILWLLFAFPFVIRRRRRTKRGLCPACAYDLRGSTSQNCPECGKAVQI